MIFNSKKSILFLDFFIPYCLYVVVTKSQLYRYISLTTTILILSVHYQFCGLRESKHLYINSCAIRMAG